MAYRRRQGMSRASTFKEDHVISPLSSLRHDNNNNNNNNDNDNNNISYKVRTFSDSSSSSSSSSSLAAQAIKAHRESSSPSSSLSSSYSSNSIPQSFRSHKVFAAQDGSLPSLAGRNDWTPSSSSSSGFWGVLARKAKSILEEEEEGKQKQGEDPRDPPTSSRFLMPDTPPQPSLHQSYFKTEGFKKMDNPTLRKGLYKITSSLNQIGDTFEKAFEEGRTIVESKTADIIQETRKLQVMRRGSSPEGQNQFAAANSPWQPLGQATQPQNQMTHETQLKASRDVAMATAAKAKLLLRELKTVKADLAFAKQRCSQLEEENKILRDSREKGGNPADDDLIRLQLETLLAEKARLAHENSVYARENRFLREIVEYHQLTMQDVVYLDEGSEEVTEVYPYPKMLSTSPPSPMSQPSPSGIDLPANLLVTKEIVTVPGSVEQVREVPSSDVQTNSKACIPEEKPTIFRPATDGEDDKVAFKLEEENATTHSKESSEIK